MKPNGAHLHRPTFLALARREAERAIADADRLHRSHYARDNARIKRLCRGAEIADEMIVPVLAAALKAAIAEAQRGGHIDAMPRIAEIREVLAAELEIAERPALAA